MPKSRKESDRIINLILYTTAIVLKINTPKIWLPINQVLLLYDPIKISDFRSHDLDFRFH